MLGAVADLSDMIVQLKAELGLPMDVVVSRPGTPREPALTNLEQLADRGKLMLWPAHVPGQQSNGGGPTSKTAPLVPICSHANKTTFIAPSDPCACCSAGLPMSFQMGPGGWLNNRKTGGVGNFAHAKLLSVDQLILASGRGVRDGDAGLADDNMASLI